MGVMIIAVVLHNITLLLNSLLTNLSIRLLFNFLIELVRPLFFHTLHSNILSVPFAVLSEVITIIAPPSSSKVLSFSHLTILVNHPQHPASRSSHFCLTLLQSIDHNQHKQSRPRTACETFTTRSGGWRVDTHGYEVLW
ncbi:hypothetical protein BLNAU_7452 [Blattamonas nauphoetae]|uniref:Uncharacterized protein n=1 Tax=Blattamonas nauphoetae TaxID=2049346 RepID=A0ABQ9Y1D4_9EUKA|nr:hypothetical protein BLNAU_7452 [Blattamonas nauphoetae]